MDLSYIYSKKFDIDQDNTFTANFSKENEIQKVVFNKENEYGVTCLTINSVLPDKKILKIENIKEQERISQEIQELVKQNKERNLTFVISHPEKKTIKITFVKKKNESELPKKKKKHFLTHQPEKTKIFYFTTTSDILKNLDLNGVNMVLNTK